MKLPIALFTMNDETDALNNTNPIPDFENYTNTNNPQEIWASVQNNARSYCFELTRIYYTIFEQPVIANPHKIYQNVETLINPNF